MSNKIEKIKQEAIDLEFDFVDHEGSFDLDKRGGGIGGTFVNDATGQSDAQMWLESYRILIIDQDRR
jgi:hypothetical protein